MSNPVSNLPERSPHGAPRKEPIRASVEGADHFSRQGFSGDILLDKNILDGVNALQVNVNGRHPRKQMQPGTTRFYYVANGEGTFTINDDTKAVAAGDLYVIPPLNEYEYEGIMTLFEFNLSPGNTFKDKLVGDDAPKVEKADRGYGPGITTNPERSVMVKAIGDILSRGYTLTNTDIDEIATHYGYPRKGSQALRSPISRQALRSSGVQIKNDHMYRGTLIIRDGSLPIEETDIENTKAKIDKKEDAAAKRRAAIVLQKKQLSKS